MRLAMLQDLGRKAEVSCSQAGGLLCDKQFGEAVGKVGAVEAPILPAAGFRVVYYYQL